MASAIRVLQPPLSSYLNKDSSKICQHGPARKLITRWRGHYGLLTCLLGSTGSVLCDVLRHAPVLRHSGNSDPVRRVYSSGAGCYGMWCGGPESNRHVPCRTRDFKSLASTSSATPAQCVTRILALWRPAWVRSLPASLGQKFRMLDIWLDDVPTEEEKT